MAALVTIVLLATGMSLSGIAVAPPAQAASVVEDAYAAAGPWAVSSMNVNVPGTPGVRVVHPTNLGAGGADHAIVVFGNGSLGHCSDLPTGSGWLLRHLASWGFVVACVRSGFVGWGTELWAAAQWMVAQDTDPASVFHGTLDAGHVGALGHSQGASGVANATVLSGGVINSTVALAMVNEELHNPPEQLPALGEIETPMLFLSGTADAWTAPEQQAAYYRRVAGPAARAALVGGDHLAVANDTVGYVTAWLRYTLEGDAIARAAFVATGGNPPEIGTNTAWTSWEARALP